MFLFVQIMTQDTSFVEDIGSFYSFSNPDLDVIEMCGTSISVNINVELRKNISTRIHCFSFGFPLLSIVFHYFSKLFHIYVTFTFNIARLNEVLDWEGVGNRQLLCFFKA
jgi:hypothetical protein